MPLCSSVHLCDSSSCLCVPVFICVTPSSCLCVPVFICVTHHHAFVFQCSSVFLVIVPLRSSVHLCDSSSCLCVPVFICVTHHHAFVFQCSSVFVIMPLCSSVHLCDSIIMPLCSSVHLCDSSSCLCVPVFICVTHHHAFVFQCSSV